MKWMIALVLAALPVPAMAQEVPGWVFAEKKQDGSPQQCFALTVSNGAAFGFQAPSDESGALLAFFGDSKIQSSPGDPKIVLGIPGKWSRESVGRDESDPEITAYSWGLDSWDEIGTFPEGFHVRVTKGSQTLFDADVANFRAAVAGVRQCVAERD